MTEQQKDTLEKVLAHHCREESLSSDYKTLSLAKDLLSTLTAENAALMKELELWQRSPDGMRVTRLEQERDRYRDALVWLLENGGCINDTSPAKAALESK